GARIVAPERDAALRAARDLLSLAAVRGRVHDLGLAAQELHALGFDHGLEREGRDGFALTPAAVTAMDEQRLRHDLVAYRTAVAAAFEREAVMGGHRAQLRGSQDAAGFVGAERRYTIAPHKVSTISEARNTAWYQTGNLSQTQ